MDSREQLKNREVWGPSDELAELTKRLGSLRPSVRRRAEQQIRESRAAALEVLLPDLAEEYRRIRKRRKAVRPVVGLFLLFLIATSPGHDSGALAILLCLLFFALLTWCMSSSRRYLYGIQALTGYVEMAAIGPL